MKKTIRRMRWLCSGLPLLVVVAACAPSGRATPPAPFSEFASGSGREVGAPAAPAVEIPSTAQTAPTDARLIDPIRAVPRPPNFPQGVPPERLARLSRGINLPFWFWFSELAPEEIDTHFSHEEFVQLRRMGFTYARLPVDGYLLLDPQDPGRLDRVWLARVDRAIDRLLAADLAVMVDVHNLVFSDSLLDLSDWLEVDETGVDDFSEFWRGFAAHLSKYDADRVFLEILNEPIFFEKPDRWPSVLATLLEAAREGAPEHTLIASGIDYARIEGLERLRPDDDLNVVYNFHFYDPFAFTHQGAVWGGGHVSPLHGVPYPSNPEAVAPLLAELPVGYPAYETLYSYGRSYWNAAAIDEAIWPAVEWRLFYGRPVICNEFGVYKKFAPREDRLRWLRDVRQTLEKYAIPWAAWEYDGDYGLAVRIGDGKVEFDAGAVEALGLTLPAP